MNQDQETKDRRQGLFDRVWKHFVTDRNPPSFVVEDKVIRCLYRGPNGRRCAVGVLLSDEEYDPSMENSTPFSKTYDAWNEVRSLSLDDRSFLQELQLCHDGAAGYADDFTEAIEERLGELAHSYDLDIPEQIGN